MAKQTKARNKKYSGAGKRTDVMGLTKRFIADKGHTFGLLSCTTMIESSGEGITDTFGLEAALRIRFGVKRSGMIADSNKPYRDLVANTTSGLLINNKHDWTIHCFLFLDSEVEHDFSMYTLDVKNATAGELDKHSTETFNQIILDARADGDKVISTGWLAVPASGEKADFDDVLGRVEKLWLEERVWDKEYVEECVTKRDAWGKLCAEVKAKAESQLVTEELKALSKLDQEKNN